MIFSNKLMITKKNKRRRLLSLGVILAGLLLPVATKALNIIPPDCLSKTAANCGLDDLAQLFINLYSIGIVYLGAIALLFLIIGGFVMLTSQGRQDRVDLGKRIIADTIIGVVVVMTAYFVINIIQTQILGVTNEEYLLTAGNDCQGKPDGTRCSLLTGEGSDTRYQNVFACVAGQCAVTMCDYESNFAPEEGNNNIKNITLTDGTEITVKKQCRERSECDPDSIETGKCPRGKDFVCCFLNVKY